MLEVERRIRSMILRQQRQSSFSTEITGEVALENF